MTERPSMKQREHPGGWWLVDIAGATLFAWGLAWVIDGLIDATGIARLGVLAMLAGGTVRGVSVWLAQARAAAAAQREIAPLRVALHRRLLAGSLPRAVPIGESAAIAIDHPDRIEAHAARFLPVRLAATMGPILVALVVALASPVAAAILIATLVPFVLGMILAGTMARRAADAQLRALEQLSVLFVERLRALAMIRHFGAGERITRQVSAAAATTAQRTLAVLRIAFLSSAVLEFFAALSVALVAVYCGFSLLGILPFPVPETLSFREALFALAMAPEFYLPMRRLAAAYHEKQLGEAAHTVVDPFLAEVPPLVATRGFAGLSVRDLEIAWPGARIGPVTFALGRTGMVALTGPTGSGKTSLLAACAGQVAPAGGFRDLIAPADIAWAAQRPLILPGTLRDNLALARPDAGDDVILEACRRVGLDRLLASRAEGLGLVLDHQGSGLSGGERRRLGIARALLSDRRLLLCDEPTADLDAPSAAQIAALLREIAQTHAVLIATHDAVLAALADQVVAL